MRTEPADFNHLAPLYRWMEWASFGPYLHRCRCAFLPEIAADATLRRALILGDGDGRFTSALLRAHPTLHVDAVDASPAMLRALQHRAAPYIARLRTHPADARTWVQTQQTQTQQIQPYDLVITHFFLDCLATEEIRALAATIRPQLAPNARWILSEFAPASGLYGRIFARPLIALLYFAFGILTGLKIRRLPDHAAALQQAGFLPERRQARLNGLLISEIWRIHEG